VNKPKLLHVSSSLLVGGAERVLYTLVQGLRDDFEQTVIYVHDGPVRQQLQALGIPTIGIQGKFFRYDPIFFVRLYRAVRRVQPDLMHTMLWAANVAGRLIARLLTIPVVSAYHNNVGQDGWLRSLCDRLTIASAQGIIAVSQQVAHGISRRSPAITPMVITNGIAIAKVTAITRAQVGIAPDAWVIGAVGRFVPVKRFELLIDAVAQLCAQGHARVHLLLIGYGALEQQYRARIAALGITDRVTLLIGQPAEPYMDMIDCFVQPSAQEGVSLALLEAMARTKVCLVMPHEGKHPVITDGINGLLARGDGVDALVERLRSLEALPDGGAAIAQRARQSVAQDFGAARMIGDYNRFFRRYASH
jgi:glycosyltransferase involved in cell wall biosynthesis